MKKNMAFCGLLVFISLSCFGQKENPYKKILEARKRSVEQNHEQSYVAQVLTGKRYELRYTEAVNSQFFKGKTPIDGTLEYDGVVFNNLEMQFDIYAQQVVVLLESKNSAQYVTVDREKVDRFSILDFNFVNVREDSVMKKGIYQLAFEGEDSNLFIKRVKKKNEKVEDSRNKIEFTPTTRYYIKNSNGTFRISGKKNLLASFDNSTELASLLKKNKIKFSKNQIEVGLITALSLFDPKNTVD